MKLEGFADIEKDIEEHFSTVELILGEALLEFPSANDILATTEASIEFISIFQAAQCRVGNWHTRTSLKKMQLLRVIKMIDEECEYTLAKPFLTRLHKFLTKLSEYAKTLEAQSKVLGDALFSLKSIQSCATARRLYEE